MLSIDIRSLETQAATIDGTLEAADGVWQDDDVRPRDGVRVTGRLSRAGGDRYYFSGRISGAVDAPCRRCLTGATAEVQEDVHVLFAEPGAEGADDPDVFVLPPRAAELDLRPAVREQWLLAAPAFVQCSDQCRGLCSRCGADLNTGPCDCAPVSDSRWDALRALRERAR
jgi:uncharacterized protein